jgi:hypothetical protein
MYRNSSASLNGRAFLLSNIVLVPLEYGTVGISCPLQSSDDELGKLNVLSKPELRYSSKWLVLSGSSMGQRMRFG